MRKLLTILLLIGCATSRPVVNKAPVRDSLQFEFITADTGIVHNMYFYDDSLNLLPDFKIDSTWMDSTATIDTIQ